MATLFPFLDIYISKFERDFSLTPTKELLTGRKVTRNMSVGWGNPSTFTYTSAAVSKFPTFFWIGNEACPAVIAWSSHSGRIYKLSDTDVDCTDIKCWFGDLNPADIKSFFTGAADTPFGLKNLNLTVTIESLNNDLRMEMTLNKPHQGQASQFIGKMMHSLMASTKPRKKMIVNRESSTIGKEHWKWTRLSMISILVPRD